MELGLQLTRSYAIVYPLFAIIMWSLFYARARDRHILRFFNSSLAVSFWEEILFRSILLGILLDLLQSPLLAIIFSSLFFGFFHLRNYWWAGKNRLIRMVLYTGLFVGPVLGWVRITTGDIYLGIFLHWLNNFIVMFPPTFYKRFVMPVPTDDSLKTKKFPHIVR